jgi:hemerythrin-like metal-binding protein
MSSDNVSGIQAQHKALEEKIQSVRTILESRSGIEDLKGQLDDLILFLQTHCEEEEGLMERYRYSGLETHARKHEELIDRIFSLREKIYAYYGEEQKQALLTFLKLDLMKHVIEDMKTWKEGGIERKYVYQRLQDFSIGSANS